STSSTTNMPALATMTYSPDAPAYSIDRIPPLNSVEDWPEWHRRLHECFTINKLSGVWKGIGAEPIEALRQLMGLACEVVKSTSGERAHAINGEFQPKGSDSFIEAMRQFADLHVDQFNDIRAYAEEFKRVLKEINDSGCKLPQVFVNTQFIMNISPSYEHLLTTAKNNDMILPDSGEQTVCLDQIICLALAFEQLKQSKREASAAPESALVNFKPYSKIIGDERVYKNKVKYCIRCNKDGHAQHECWVLHPELRKRRPAQQQQQQQQPQQRKRKADEMENDQDEMESDQDESEDQSEDQSGNSSSDSDEEDEDSDDSDDNSTEEADIPASHNTRSSSSHNKRQRTIHVKQEST
ncbi:MAG: hypothetical protein Q9218_001667, partial [Villophora microphyllina]